MFGREFLLIKKEKNPEFASLGNFGCPLFYGQLIEDPSFLGHPVVQKIPRKHSITYHDEDTEVEKSIESTGDTDKQHEGS